MGFAGSGSWRKSRTPPASAFWWDPGTWRGGAWSRGRGSKTNWTYASGCWGEGCQISCHVSHCHLIPGFVNVSWVSQVLLNGGGGETIRHGAYPAGETMRRLRKLVEDVKCHHHLPCSIFQGPNQFTKIGFIVLSNGLLSGLSSAMLNQTLSLSRGMEL